jgi:hypothetical protein
MDEFNTKQQKYRYDFNESLQTSQQLVYEVCDTICNGNPNIFLRSEDDSVPLRNSALHDIRFLDIRGYDLVSRSHFYVEVKDFCSMVKYDATGLPASYVDSKLNTFRWDSVYVIFKDNEAFYEARRKAGIPILPNTCKTNAWVDEMPVAYGERLDVLMANRITELEGVINCRWPGKYNGDQQYMWNTRIMKTVPELMNRDFPNVLNT